MKCNALSPIATGRGEPRSCSTPSQVRADAARTSPRTAAIVAGWLLTLAGACVVIAACFLIVADRGLPVTLLLSGAVVFAGGMGVLSLVDLTDGGAR